jgi:hypothetical protein
MITESSAINGPPVPKIKCLNMPKVIYIGPWDPKQIFKYRRTGQVDIHIQTNIAKTNICRREYSFPTNIIHANTNNSIFVLLSKILCITWNAQ